MSAKLTPDSATADRAKKLKSTKFWRSLSGEPSLIWGECKSSGLTFYKIAFDVKTTSFRCNCASRKYPCKHGLALSMLFVEQPDAFVVPEERPEWVAEWIAKGKPTQLIDSPEAEKIKAENRQKNFSKRLDQMLAGLDELENWLQDTLRQGVASLQQQPPSYWQNISARLYDAKLSAIGKKIKLLPTIIHSIENWPSLLLEELTNCYLLVRGLRRMEELPLNIQQDLLSYAGVSTRKEELFQYGQPVKDIWMVLGVTEKEEDNLKARKTWILGHQTKHYGMVLDFAFGRNPYSANYLAGNVFIGQTVFYPSNVPLRVAIKEKNILDRRIKRIVGFETISQYLDFYAQSLAANPFYTNFPCSLENVSPVLEKQQLQLIDTEEKVIPVNCSSSTKWKILAASGGNPINIFGEWSGSFFEPISLSIQQQFIEV